MKSAGSLRRRILVVDDEPAVRDTIKLLLELEEYDVETATNGSEALAMIQAEKFDLILTDYAMPGMTGEELATEIKASLPGQPVGMVSAYAHELEASVERVKGVDFLISKPFALKDLLALVAEALPKQAEQYDHPLAREN